MRRFGTGPGLVLIALMGVAGIASAAVSVYLSPEQLSERASLVVEGTVAASRSGLDPTTNSLHTYVTLKVDAVHRGPEEITELVIREPGGAWGDLVNVLDAVPVYTSGERVFVFLEPSGDGALRTTGMFFGKFRLVDELARGPLLAERDLEGQGTILGRAETTETLTRNDLIAITAAVSPRGSGRTARPGTGSGRATRSRTPRPWFATPPEWNRLEWDRPSRAEPNLEEQRVGSAAPVALQASSGSGVTPQFVALSQSNPTRWTQADSGGAVSINVEPGGNPLNDNAAAVSEIARALAAWTDLPEARLQLTLGNTNDNYTANNGSPASSYSGTNVVLFNDPYDDISDPTGCGGVLAIGGYWRSGSTGTPINNVAFHPALQLYVIFNNNFECYLGNADNLAEVAAHEIGHGIGFGHSSVSDAIMRSSAYGNRGPRLGDDDRDAAHCHYPHQLTLLAPNGGETLVTGASATIDWLTSSEAGGDEGTVDLEYSIDGGTVWKPLVTATPNDGSYGWTIPDDPSTDVRVRVLRAARSGNFPSPYPSSNCSNDASNGSLSIVASSPVAGIVGDGLVLTKAGKGEIRADWAASCSGQADNYALYEGDLMALRAGSWDHTPLSCNAGSDLSELFTPAAGLTYYLVSPRAAALEGNLGSGSGDQLRPASTSACAPREAAGC